MSFNRYTSHYEILYHESESIMAMTAASMAAKIEANIQALTLTPTNDAGTAQTYHTDILNAFCAGIIEEIQENAVVTTTSGAPDGEHTGIIE